MLFSFTHNRGSKGLFKQKIEVYIEIAELIRVKHILTDIYLNLRDHRSDEDY